MPSEPKTKSTATWKCCVCDRNNDMRWHPDKCTNPACEPHERCGGCTLEVHTLRWGRKSRRLYYGLYGLRGFFTVREGAAVFVWGCV